MLKIKTWVAALGLSAIVNVTAMAAEITGAGATFPLPNLCQVG